MTPPTPTREQVLTLPGSSRKKGFNQFSDLSFIGSTPVSASTFIKPAQRESKTSGVLLSCQASSDFCSWIYFLHPYGLLAHCATLYRKELALMTSHMEMTVVRRLYGQLDSYRAIPFEQNYHCCSRNPPKVIYFIYLRTVVRTSSACVLAFLGEFITIQKSAWLLSMISCLAL